MQRKGVQLPQGRGSRVSVSAVVRVRVRARVCVYVLVCVRVRICVSPGKSKLNRVDWKCYDW